MLTEDNTNLTKEYHLDHPYPGTFIVLEGIDGSGKTTLCKKITEDLENEGHTVITVREPGGTRLGEHIREAYKDSSFEISEDVRLLLLYASRLALMEETILPALKAGHVVIADRYFYSTFAMQYWAGKCDEKLFFSLNEKVVTEANPDYVFFLDISLETRRERLKERVEEKDAFDLRSDDYHQKVLEGYRALHSMYHGSVTEGGDSRFYLLKADTSTVEEMAFWIRNRIEGKVPYTEEVASTLPWMEFVKRWLPG